MNDPTHVTILKEIAELLNEETEIESMLQGSLEKFLEGTDFHTGWIFFIEETGRHTLIAHENLPEVLMQKDCFYMKTGGCWCVNRFRQGRLKKASNIIECKRITEALDKSSENPEGITHHATVPLQSGSERFGLLNVATPGRRSFEEHELALLESVAFQIGSAIKRIQLTKKEQEVALMQERNRLARDLHDSVNQLLFSMTLTARGGAEMSDDQDVKETFHSLQSLAQEALTEMRALIWQLRPKGMEGGLTEALDGFAEMLGLKASIKIEGVLNLPAKVEETIFRIGQEAITNCKRHAEAEDIYIWIEAKGDKIEMTIRDFGRGFFPEHTDKVPSVGLSSMQERTRLLNGEFSLKSAPSEGTQIKVILPY
ncbi:GAF domain-containing sensor histidine kinase [Jeotgalibacillus terrae]|uniref:histidine kinase n=1 Tax=Jeotgalibacillus terrae TaxID=587735 RepID=A0ABW5ZD75_9BACL|nr:GAF domain-containing sensor histidine kinase [Jeotgalibacillus terrae]MBM7580852.1 two-component system NarL family sensor kinase [Jeotgalibacillus terrae]